MSTLMDTLPTVAEVATEPSQAVIPAIRDDRDFREGGWTHWTMGDGGDGGGA